jgi:predicted protein tyrosine phosphatase
MDEQHIEAMIRVLKPVLKDRAKAQKILARYWRNQMALVWSVEDVYRAANELELALTKKEAVEVLESLRLHYNRHLGLRWEDITSHITENVLGRELTKREIREFVHHDRLTIQR